MDCDYALRRQMARHVVEQFVDGEAARDHALREGEVDDDIERLAVRLDAVA
jgi:hypothetical protein